MKHLGICIFFVVGKGHGRLQAVRELVDEKLQDFNENRDFLHAVLKGSSLRTRSNTAGVPVGIAVILNRYRDFRQSSVVERDAVMQKLCQCDRAEFDVVRREWLEFYSSSVT